MLRGFYLFRHLISSRFFIEIMSYICYIHYIDYKKRLHMYLVLIAFLWLLLEFIYFLFHLKPLNNNEIQKLSQKRKEKYIKQNYNFTVYNISVNKSFKSSMKPSGKWYDTQENLSRFPSLVAALLKGKKHEWIVIAIEKDGIVYGFYANKGTNNSTVSFNCSLDFIMSKCEVYNCSTIMCFHNHPNDNPHYQNCLISSHQDLISAQYCANYVRKKYNWIDFVCERGRFIKYYEAYSPSFLPANAKIDYIITQNNISKFKNYKLHRELGFFH